MCIPEGSRTLYHPEVHNFIQQWAAFITLIMGAANSTLKYVHLYTCPLTNLPIYENKKGRKKCD